MSKVTHCDLCGTSEGHISPRSLVVDLPYVGPVTKIPDMSSLSAPRHAIVYPFSNLVDNEYPDFAPTDLTTCDLCDQCWDSILNALAEAIRAGIDNSRVYTPVYR